MYDYIFSLMQSIVDGEMVPSKYLPPNPQNPWNATLHGKRNFANVIRLRIFIWDSYSDYLSGLNVIIIIIKSRSHVLSFVTSWTEACQVPLSMGFTRQEHQIGLPLPFSRRPSWLRDQTRVSCTGRQVLYHWGIDQKGPHRRTWGR